MTDQSSVLLRHEVAYVLGQTQSPVGLPALRESLQRKNEHSMVRHESAEALGAFACCGVRQSILLCEPRTAAAAAAAAAVSLNWSRELLIHTVHLLFLTGAIVGEWDACREVLEQFVADEDPCVVRCVPPSLFSIAKLSCLRVASRNDAELLTTMTIACVSQRASMSIRG